MKFYISLLSFLILASTMHAGSKENKFWKWFQENESSLYNFKEDQSIFKTLADQLHAIDPNLTFEFGDIDSTVKTFVISADGIKASFPAVEKLYNAKPTLDRWTIVKFRPRKDIETTIEYEGLSLKMEDVYFKLTRDKNGIGISLYIRNYKPADSRYTACSFLILDNILGEYDVETKTGFIERLPLSASQTKSLHNVALLREEFDKMYDKWFHK